MRTHAVCQFLGDRSHQCDATATYSHKGARAYVLCDGIGSSEEVRAWTRTAARRLARAAALQGDAEAGLRSVYNAYGDEPRRRHDRANLNLPAACAVVAVTAPGKLLTIAWCGDCRAYVRASDGTLTRLTSDHNLRRVLNGNRNMVTSHLGSAETDMQVRQRFGHPAIESVSHDPSDVRLLLASDGAYEPLEDSSRNLTDYLSGTPREAARAIATTALQVGRGRADNATALVADLTV
ncbi:protein phosphatase 2C domain-containing protein [Streptomyces sp. 1222.5]|uniref:protein phosphatase 2C domain-containing protein n=1 Tax=Streptomyces sp. 1222.5 TaxID=1881026 RepID=UPI003EBAE4C5